MLINTIDQLKTVLGGVQTATSLPVWNPFLEQAELSYIRPATGDELYNKLIGNGTLSEKETFLKKLLQISTGYFAYWIGLPQLTTTMGDRGVSMSNPSQAQPMSKWAYVNLQKQLLGKAEKAIEDALAYLEKNKEDFETWVNSEAFTLSRNTLISSATELTIYFPHTKKSRRLFLAQKEFIQKSEDFSLTGLIGEQQLEAWREKLKELEELSAEETKALKLARFFVANDSFKESVLFLNISEDWRLISETDGILNEDVLPAERRAEIRLQCQKEAEVFGAKLVKYLNENASEDLFTEYFNSEHYKPPVTGEKVAFKNNPCNKYFVL